MDLSDALWKQKIKTLQCIKLPKTEIKKQWQEKSKATNLNRREKPSDWSCFSFSDWWSSFKLSRNIELNWFQVHLELSYKKINQSHVFWEWETNLIPRLEGLAFQSIVSAISVYRLRFGRELLWCFVPVVELKISKQILISPITLKWLASHQCLCSLIQ